MRPAVASFRISRPLVQSAVRRSYRQQWLSTAPATPEPPSNESSDKGKGKATSNEAEKSAKREDTLPLLQRPLGVREKPKAKVKSWTDTKEKFLDQDKRMEERTHLYVPCQSEAAGNLTMCCYRAREATRGYFSDLNATRRHGGKTWIAPKVMIREDVSWLRLVRISC